MTKFWVPTVLVTTLMIAGPALSGRLVSPRIALNTFLFGGGLGVIFGITLLALGLWAWRTRRGWYKNSLLGAIVPAALGFFMIGPLFLLADGPTHRFNDVTTNLDHVPDYIVGPAANKPYPDEFIAWHRFDFPDLKTARLDTDWDASFDKVRETAKAQADWEVIYEDRRAGIIQAVARSKLFRFEDDVVIRLTRTPNGQVEVDLRSKSRIGMGDRGANAARISLFLRDLTRS